jgi:hypothetical protein
MTLATAAESSAQHCNSNRTIRSTLQQQQNHPLNNATAAEPSA